MCHNLYADLDFYQQLIDTPAPILQTKPNLSSQLFARSSNVQAI